LGREYSSPFGIADGYINIDRLQGRSRARGSRVARANPMVLSSSFLTQLGVVIEAIPPLDIGTIMHAYLLQTELKIVMGMLGMNSLEEASAEMLLLDAGFELLRASSI
jgi:hypothetical protein